MQHFGAPAGQVKLSVPAFPWPGRRLKLTVLQRNAQETYRNQSVGLNSIELSSGATVQIGSAAVTVIRTYP